MNNFTTPIPEPTDPCDETQAKLLIALGIFTPVAIIAIGLGMVLLCYVGVTMERRAHKARRSAEIAFEALHEERGSISSEYSPPTPPLPPSSATIELTQIATTTLYDEIPPLIIPVENPAQGREIHRVIDLGARQTDPGEVNEAQNTIDPADLENRRMMAQRISHLIYETARLSIHSDMQEVSQFTQAILPPFNPAVDNMQVQYNSAYGFYHETLQNVTIQKDNEQPRRHLTALDSDSQTSVGNGIFVDEASPPVKNKVGYVYFNPDSDSSCDSNDNPPMSEFIAGIMRKECPQTCVALGGADSLEWEVSGESSDETPEASSPTTSL